MDGCCRCSACASPNYLDAQRLVRAETEPIRCWHCGSFLDHRAVEIDSRPGRFQHLTGRRVEMMAGGILYRGVFVEMTDEDVKIRGRTGWIILPAERVTRIVEEGADPSGMDPRKDVSPDFYDEES